MDHHSVAYVGFDTSKTKHAVAVAESGREGEVGPSTCYKKVNKLSGFQTGPSGLLYHRFVPRSTPFSRSGSVHPTIGAVAV